MPTGVVKTFDAEAKYGFITNDDNGLDVYVNAEDADTLTSGDLVEFELDDDAKRARTVKVTTKAPEGNPSGRVMHQPPSWDILEDRDRARRASRRRRR